MADNNNKGGGKLLTGIICFFVGFIVALAAEFAVIAGCIYWLYNTDLTTIFDTIGIENTEEDEQTGQTNYIYINTSEITSVSDLISEIRALADKGTDSLTLNDLDNFPIVDSVVDTIYSTLASALDITEAEVYDIIDVDELKSTALSQLGEFLSGCLGNIKISTILKIAGMDAEDTITLALAYGSEAGTITVDGSKLVIYKESLTLAEGTAVSYTTSDGYTLPDVYEDYVYSANGKYMLYYYVTGNTAYVAQRSSSAYTQVYTDAGNTTLLEYNLYNAATATYSGAYYYNDNNELVVLSENTIGDITESDDGLTALLNDIYLSDLIAVTDDNQIFIDALDGVSVGDMLSGDGLDISELFSDILVTDLLGDSTDEVLLDIFEGITLGELMDGSLDLDEILGKIHVPEVMDVSADNGIMAFIGYSLTGIEAGTGDITVNGETVTYSYTATLHIYTDDGNNVTDDEYTAYIAADSSEVITGVYYQANGEYTEYEGVSISDISAQADRLMDTVKIGDMVTFDSSSMLIDRIKDSTINDISNVIDTLTIVEAMDGVATDDSAIILYIAYGISGFDSTEYTNGGTYYVYEATYNSYGTEDDFSSYDGKTVYVLADTDGNITGVYASYENSAYTEEITATPVNDVSLRIDGLMGDLTIGDIIDNTSNSVILNAIADSTIEDLADNIDNLAIQEVFYNQIYEQASVYDEDGKKDSSLSNYKVDQYLKVVYESIPSNTGTFYLYTVTDSATSFETYNRSTDDIKSYASGDKDDSTNKYTIYWTDGSGVYYQVLAYSRAYLYLDSSKNYIEINGYETGHIDSATILATYVSGKVNANESGIVYTYGTPDGTWYFMLYAEYSTTDTTLVEHIYSVDHIEELTGNATDNLENATLSELTNAGILSLTSIQLATPVSTEFIKDSQMLAKYQNDGYVVKVSDSYSYVLMGNLYLADTISIFINALGTISGGN